MKNIVLGITGASGGIYGLRLLEVFQTMPVRVHLIVTNAGKLVLAHETDVAGGDIRGYVSKKDWDDRVTVYNAHDLFAPTASGSFRHDGMVVAPCSMGTLAAIAGGISGNLVRRAADVCLKERRPLILMPREMPLNKIHLENMARAVDAGSVILPPTPAFYHHPATVMDLVDTVVARVLDHLGLEHDLAPRWGSDHPAPGHCA